MKLARVEIENFRHLGTKGRPLTLDFTDALGRVRDFTLLVGPNTCGKTTILDAIAAALGPGLGISTLRPDFKLSPRTVVRRGALNAKVACWLRFSPEEIAETQKIFRLAGLSEKAPEIGEMKLVWTYPEPHKPSKKGNTSTVVYIDPDYINHPRNFGKYPHQLTLWGEEYGPTESIANSGGIESDPERGWVLLHGRDQAARLLATGRADWSSFRQLGGVFTFDQERTGLGKSISRQARNIIHGATGPSGGTGGTGGTGPTTEELRTTDPRTILIDLALQSLVPSIALNGQVADEFRRIQERYAHVCSPHRILGAVRDELGEFDVRFTDGENEYTYDGLSSGEKNVLLLLIRFVAEHIHQSIVLIDELELNQHPLWQRALVHMVPKMGDGNQIIATTHSPYLRGAVAPENVIDLGNLDEASSAGAE